MKVFIPYEIFLIMLRFCFEEITFLGEGSFVPHDDTFSIKSFSSLVHFSALLGVAKMFVYSL